MLTQLNTSARNLVRQLPRRNLPQSAVTKGAATQGGSVRAEDLGVPLGQGTARCATWFRVRQGQAAADRDLAPIGEGVVSQYQRVKSGEAVYL